MTLGKMETLNYVSCIAEGCR